MDKPKKERLAKAVNAILPIVAELTESEWCRIKGLVDFAYTSKAAKVTLDGPDMEALKRRLHTEILGESFSK